MLTTFQLPLPRGVSSGTSVPDCEKIGFSAFAEACRHAARVVRGKIENCFEAYAGAFISYHEATVSYDFGRKSCRVLCSACYPVIAFATVGPPRDSCDFSFIDNSAIAAAIGEKLDCTVLRAEDASRGISQNLLELLDDAEKQDVRYWKPRRVGDVVFNHWD